MNKYELYDHVEKAVLITEIARLRTLLKELYDAELCDSWEGTMEEYDNLLQRVREELYEEE